MSADDDVIIDVESLDEPFDTTEVQPKQVQPRQEAPVRLKVPGREDKPRETNAAVEDLRGQLTEAQRRAEDAERRAQHAAEVARGATSQVERARTVIADTTITALDNEIASATTESNSLRAALKAAFDSGDFEKATALQEQIADVRARLYDAKQRKGRVEEEGAVTRPHEGAVREQPREQPTPLTAEQERQNVLAKVSPATRAWLEQHPRVLESRASRTEAQAAHERAVEAGHRVDTPEYFRFVEERLGYNTVTRTQQNGRRNGASESRESRIEAAPVDRGGGGGDDLGGSGSERVSLSKGEVENATNGTVVWNTGPNKGKPVGVKEFARRKAIMMKEGKYMSPAVS